MNKQIGRNDPCPCGSGKKYKKCCLRKDDTGTATAAGFQSKFRFEAGSYGDVGGFMPSIACLKLRQSGEWTYHFVLVKPTQLFDEEDQAVTEAGDDLYVVFDVKNKGGTDEAMAVALKSKGYLSVDDFNIVGSSEFQA